MHPLKETAGQEFTLVITSLTTEAQGVARLPSGLVIFIPHVLPAEIVKARILEVGKKFAKGELLEIVQPSPHRVEPICPYYNACGGCHLMHLDYEGQLRFKRHQVEDAISRIANNKKLLIANTLPMDPPLFYRNKGSFVFGMQEQTPTLGYYQQNSHQTLEISSCYIMQKEHDILLSIIRNWAKEYHIQAFDRVSGKGILRHAVLQYSNAKKWQVAIVATQMPPHIEVLSSLLQKSIPTLAGLIVNENNAKGIQILGSHSTTIFGSPYLHETILGLTFRVSLHSFLQANTRQSETLYQTALDACKLTGEETVVDAYCGVGTLSLLFSQHVKRVIGIELTEQAVEDAMYNATENNIQNASFLCGKAEDKIAEVLQSQPIDIIVANPPRTGCKKEFLDAVVENHIQTFVYISCNPGTLARDIKVLEESRYTATLAQPVDMFAQSRHVETVVLMSRNI